MGTCYTMRAVQGESMGLFRVLVCLFCPPLAVLDKGCGSILIVAVLTGVGWVFSASLRRL